MTEHTQCTFTVKEFNEHIRFLSIEQHSPGLSITKSGTLGLWLREGTSFEDAKELARILKEKVATISFQS